MIGDALPQLLLPGSAVAEGSFMMPLVICCKRPKACCCVPDGATAAADEAADVSAAPPPSIAALADAWEAAFDSLAAPFFFDFDAFFGGAGCAGAGGSLMGAEVGGRGGVAALILGEG